MSNPRRFYSQMVRYSHTWKPLRALLFAAAVLALLSCSFVTQIFDPTASQTPTIIFFVTPTETPIPTATPFPTRTPGSMPDPVLKGTLLPQPVERITADNAHRVGQLARWGTEAERGQDIVFAPDGITLAVSVGRHGAQLWSVPEGRFLTTLHQIPQLNENISTSKIAISPDGEWVVVGKSNWAKLWSLPTREYQGDFDISPNNNNTIYSVAISPSSEILALGFNTGSLQLIKISDRTTQVNFTPRTNTITDLTFSPDGNKLISGSADGTITIWDVANSFYLGVFGEQSPIESISYSPNGALLAVGGKRGDVRIWDVYDRSILISLWHNETVQDLAFSPSGLILATASEDRIIRLWRVADGELLAELKGHTLGVYSLDFSPDGRLLASQGVEGTVRIWGVWP